MAMKGNALRWIAGGAVAVLVLYGLLLGVLAFAMLQPPERFGLIMKHLPQALVWSVTPAEGMWLWARRGDLREGDVAPDFTLSSLDRSHEVSLSSHRGGRPVVLVFGSYT
jgi:hypothetical protein